MLRRELSFKCVMELVFFQLFDITGSGGSIGGIQGAALSILYIYRYLLSKMPPPHIKF